MGDRTRAKRARRAWMMPHFVRVLRGIRWVVQALPDRAAQALAWVAAAALWLLLPRAPIRRNLQLMTGGDVSWRVLARFERRYAMHMGYSVVEWLRLPLFREEHFEAQGLEELRQINDMGGVIFVTGHAGQWELGAYMGGRVGLAMTVTTKLSGQDDMDAFGRDLREASGNSVIDSRNTIWTLKKRLDRGQNIGLDVDQQARTNNVFLPFFGVKCACSATPASLQLQTKRPIAVCVVHRVGRWRYRLTVQDIIPYQSSGKGKAARLVDSERIIARVNRSFERAIQEFPEQWLWSHRRYRRRPPTVDEGWPLTRSQPDVRLDLSRFAC